jgi:2-methylisocitrate lyase-like PEP mutase family enzyme
MRASLRQNLVGSQAVLAPGVYDPLSALLAERAGFSALYVSGAAVAYTQLARPDIGLVSLGELVDVVWRISDRVGLPLIIDADTGFGNALNTQRTVRMIERAGAAAIQIEDQTYPKRCGHLSGKNLVGTEEMAGKIRAAVDSRQSADTLIIARTDAIAVEGFEAALDRADAYLSAGADILFVEAPRTLDEMRRVVERFAGRVPLVANMVEGGDTPILDRGALSDLGFSLVISPGALVRALVPMAEAFFAALRDTGTTASFRDRMTDLRGINVRIGLDELLAEGQRYDPDLMPGFES